MVEFNNKVVGKRNDSSYIYLLHSNRPKNPIQWTAVFCVAVRILALCKLGSFWEIQNYSFLCSLIPQLTVNVSSTGIPGESRGQVPQGLQLQRFLPRIPPPFSPCLEASWNLSTTYFSFWRFIEHVKLNHWQLYENITTGRDSPITTFGAKNPCE